MNVKFIQQTAIPAEYKASWDGLFMYVTEGDDKGLYFGQGEWKKLSNVPQSTASEIHSASVSDEGVVSFFNSTDGTGDALLTLSLAKVAKTGAAADVTLSEYAAGGSDSSKITEGTSVQTAIETILSAIDGLTSETADGLQGLEDAIGVLNGTDEIEGSVKKQIKDAIAAVVNGAPEAFDTLKEIAAWISSDETGTAEIISDITKLKGDVADIKEDIEDLQESAYVGVENADADQYVKVSDKADNKQTLSVTIGSFSVEATAESEAVDMVPGLATVEDVEEIIKDNELVTAAALNDLNDRLKVFEDGSESIETQIETAIAGVTGDLGDSDAETLEAINDELNAIDTKVAALEQNLTWLTSFPE